jgi:hypothetical protein
MNAGYMALIISLILIFALYSFFRVRGGVRDKPEVVNALLRDIRLNQALVKGFHLQEKARRFEKTHWDMNKSNIGFLDEPLQELLRTTFDTVDDLNRQIKVIRKDKTRSHREIDITELGELLTKCREALEGWMMEVVGVTQLPTKYPSLMGMFIGER